MMDWRRIRHVPLEMPTLEAIRLMREQRIASLPVARDGQLLGIVTESDFLRIAGVLLEDARKPKPTPKTRGS